MTYLASFAIVRRIPNGVTSLRSYVSLSIFAVILARYLATGSDPDSDESCKAANLAKKLRTKTPIGKLDELPEGKHPYQEKDPLPAWPNNTNPSTGEVGGPRGPEPTRYGDWERKGRVSDF